MQEGDKKQSEKIRLPVPGQAPLLRSANSTQTSRRTLAGKTGSARCCTGHIPDLLWLLSAIIPQQQCHFFTNQSHFMRQ
jgi:hypothetical protein